MAKIVFGILFGAIFVICVFIACGPLITISEGWIETYVTTVEECDGWYYVKTARGYTFVTTTTGDVEFIRQNRNSVYRLYYKNKLTPLFFRSLTRVQRCP